MAVMLSALRASRLLAPRKISCTHFCYSWVDPRVIVRLEGLGELKKSSYLNGNRTRDLPACSTVSQSTRLPRPPRSWKHRRLMKVSLCLEGETFGPINMYSYYTFMFCSWQKWHVKRSWESQNFRYGRSNPCVPIHIIRSRRRRSGASSSIRT
jgi:hypothetical protein